MSRNDEKAGKITDMDFSALDQELAEMAGETPDVPADFHDRWMKAVREEAKNNPRENMDAGRNKEENRKADAQRQRRYLLSAAAAFVLVIGGVWLLRDRIDLLNRVKTASGPEVQEETVSMPAQETAQEEPSLVPAPVPEQEEEVTVLSADSDEPVILAASMSDNGAGEASESVMYYAAGGSAGEASYQAFAQSFEETESAYEADEESFEMDEDYSYAELNGDASAAAGVPLYAAMKTDTAGETSGRKTVNEAGENEVGKTEAAAEAPAEPEMTPAPTEMPVTPEAAEETETQPEAPEGAAATAAENQNEEEPSFLQRLWNFLLRITPWALGVVVIALFLVTYVIRVKQRKGK